MQRGTIAGWIAGVTLISAGGVWLSPQYQLWQWMQRYGSVSEAQERLRANPDDAKAHLTLAWTMLSSDTSGKGVYVKEARHEWEEVIRCDPSNEMAVVIFAPMLFVKGNQADKERAKQLLLPIAERGNPRIRPEARKMLQDLGAPVS